MSSSNTIPVPENEEDPASERRLRIGNLDLRISEQVFQCAFDFEVVSNL